MKIIAFIHPEKFFWLLGEELAKRIKYFTHATDEFGRRKVFLEGGKSLIYLTPKSGAEVGKFDSKKSDESPIVVISDNFELTYNPSTVFKIVFHTETPKKTLDVLRKNINYRGEIFNQEEEYYGGKISNYKLIADLIRSGFENVSFQKMYSDIPEFNYELELKLELLHSCLESTGATQALKGDISFLSDKEKKIIEFLAKHKDNLSKEYIDKLTELRITLLGS